jgi:hypothetical protein
LSFSCPRARCPVGDSWRVCWVCAGFLVDEQKSCMTVFAQADGFVAPRLVAVPPSPRASDGRHARRHRQGDLRFLRPAGRALSPGATSWTRARRSCAGRLTCRHGRRGSGASLRQLGRARPVRGPARQPCRTRPPARTWSACSLSCGQTRSSSRPVGSGSGMHSTVDWRSLVHSAQRFQSRFGEIVSGALHGRMAGYGEEKGLAIE